MTSREPADDAFAAATTRAAGWAFAALVAGRAISVVCLAILARLLTPVDFGVVAIALAYLTYAETVTDLGTAAALIYSPARGRAQDDIAQVTFVVNVVVGWVWFAITLAVTPWLAAFFHHDGIPAILSALAWTFPLKALGATHDALTQKDLRFRARLVPEVGLALTKGLLAVTLALAGMGVWSLVWGHLAGVAMSTLLLWLVVPWRPGWRLPLDRLRPVLAYGGRIVAVNVVAAVVHHADLVIVGRVLGATALGLYQMAARVPDLSLLMVARVGGRVMFPALARIGRRGQPVAEAYLVGMRRLALVVLPAAAGLALLAEPTVAVMFGPQWTAAAPVLRFLAVYAGLRALGSLAGEALKAMGRPGLLASLGVVKATIVVPTLLLVAPAGVVAVAAALAAVTLLGVLLNIVAVWRIAGVDPARLIAALRPGALAAAAILGIQVAWLHTARGAPDWMLMLGGMAAGGAIYVLVLRLVEPRAVSAWTARMLASGGRR